MLDALSDKFEKILKKLRGQGVLTEQNIGEALKEVRLALLEADVNFKVVKDFLDRVREKAIGQDQAAERGFARIALLLVCARFGWIERQLNHVRPFRPLV